MVSKFIKSGLSRPLEEDDLSIFYPDSDGVPLAETDFQFYPLTETVHALRLHFTERPDVYVSGDMLMYYRMNDNTVRVAPDVFVVFGVDDHMRRSYIIWREGGKTPDFVMEIASPSTYVRDATEKRAIYAAFGVTEYWRFDPTEELLYSTTGRGNVSPKTGFTKPSRFTKRQHPAARCGDTARSCPWIFAYSPACNSDCMIRSTAAGCGTSRNPKLPYYLRRPPAILPKLLYYLRRLPRQSSEAAHQAAEERLRRLEAQLREQGIAPTDDN